MLGPHLFLLWEDVFLSVIEPCGARIMKNYIKIGDSLLVVIQTTISQVIRIKIQMFQRKRLEND